MSRKSNPLTRFSRGDVCHSGGKKIPRAFCWTKMGAEAGQALNGILARKDAERELGDGIFFWGIGTPLGARFWNFVEQSPQPIALFSPMKAKAKAFDVQPERVFAWTSYIDRNGSKHPVPKHVFVTSRGTTNQSTKSRHYALVCKKDRPLLSDEWPCLHRNELRNYQAESMLGFSQVTAVVEHFSASEIGGGSYEVLFGATLVAPYYVTLTDPVEIPRTFVRDFDNFWENEGWKGFYEEEELRRKLIGDEDSLTLRGDFL